MITIFKNRKDIPFELIEFNDLFFNTVTSPNMKMEPAKKIIAGIDGTELVGRFQIKSKFNGEFLNVDRLSTGCKTALNVYFNPKKVFSIKECGDNALEMIYGFETGMVYSEYPVIPFDFTRVVVVQREKSREIGDYAELKEWWEDEQ